MINLPSVVSPPDYNAGFCQGHCNDPIPPTQAVFHSRLMSMDANGPNPCCVPVAYKSVVVVQHNNVSSNTFTLVALSNMSVARCGCR